LPGLCIPKTMKLNTRTLNLLIILAGAVLFIPFLGAVHLFDWDEINFAECAREMIRSHDYSGAQINFFPFWEKPPLFIWLQVLSMQVFGINEFAARLPNALCGIATLLVVFNLGRKIYGTRFGLLWVLAFAGSLLPHFYFKSGLIDPLFNLLIFLGIYQFAAYTQEYDEPRSGPLFNWRVVLSALFIGLGILTKGPVAALVFGLCFIVYSVSARRFAVSLRHLILFCVVVAGVGGGWFMILLSKGRADIVLEFIQYQIRLFSTEDADHGGPIYYHFVVLLIGCFPASVFALAAFTKNTFDTPYQKHFKRWMLILFWVVLILFSMVKTKIVHYSSLCYFPLTYLGAYTAYKWMLGEFEWKRWMSVLSLVIGGGLGIILSALQFVALFKERIIAGGLINDNFALGNLQANVSWSGFEFLIGILFLCGVLGGFLFARRGQAKAAVLTFFLCTLLATNASTLVFAPKIEGYSQHAAIEFYESLQGKDCYVDVTGFKSYAHLFYSHKSPEANKSPLFLAYIQSRKLAHPEEKLETNPSGWYSTWLAEGIVDKPVYYACKNTHEKEFTSQHPSFTRLYAKNGFVFFVRPASMTAKF
jgi:4-amino-4-deoxy-L-arabinose transferase-like glycosyltransferase